MEEVSLDQDYSCRNHRTVPSGAVEICTNVSRIPTDAFDVAIIFNRTQGFKDRSNCLTTNFSKLCSNRGACKH